jgi:hypothetical protein
MKRLFVFAVIGVAAWYGWHHRDALDDLLHKKPHQEVVVRNNAGETVTRLRVTVGDQTFVKESLASGETVTFPFAVNSDSKFDVAWEYAARTNEGHWQGGEVAPGPLVSRHVITIGQDQGIVYETQPLPVGTPGTATGS